jgi:predicted secreted protein
MKPEAYWQVLPAGKQNMKPEAYWQVLPAGKQNMKPEAYWQALPAGKQNMKPELPERVVEFCVIIGWSAFIRNNCWQDLDRNFQIHN